MKRVVLAMAASMLLGVGDANSQKVSVEDKAKKWTMLLCKEEKGDEIEILFNDAGDAFLGTEKVDAVVAPHSITLDSIGVTSRLVYEINRLSGTFRSIFRSFNSDGTNPSNGLHGRGKCEVINKSKEPLNSAIFERVLTISS